MTSFIVLAWVAMAVALVWLGSACLQRRSIESAALYIEARHPALHNHLISALQLPESLQKHPESGISSELVEGLLEVHGAFLEQARFLEEFDARVPRSIL